MPGPANERPQPLNAEEVAAELRLNPYTVRRMLERGDLPGVNLGGRWYIQRAALDALLAGERR